MTIAAMTSGGYNSSICWLNVFYFLSFQRPNCVCILCKGVCSVKLEGDEKDRVVVIGEGVDAVGMIVLLRKKVGHATLELVAECKD